MSTHDSAHDAKQDSAIYIDLLRDLIRKKYQFLASSVAFLGFAIWLAFFHLEKTYLSTVAFLPPSSNSGMPSFLGNDLAGLVGSGRSSLSGEQVKLIAEGHGFSSYLIKRFDLSKRYKIKDGPGILLKTEKILAKKIKIIPQENTGIGFSSVYAFVLSVEDRSPDTAAIICAAAYHYLDSIVMRLTSQKARQSATFLKAYISDKEIILDSLQEQMTAFRKKNKILDVGSQQQLSVGLLGGLKEQVIRQELEYATIAATKGVASNDALLSKSMLETLRQKLKHLETNEKPDLMLSVARSAEAAPAFYKLARDLEIESRAILLLRQQLESERLEEVRTTSPLQTIDPANVPDYKIRPKRIFILLGVFAFGLFLHISAAIYLFLIKRFVRKSRILERLRAADS